MTQVKSGGEFLPIHHHHHLLLSFAAWYVAGVADGSNEPSAALPLRHGRQHSHGGDLVEALPGHVLSHEELQPERNRSRNRGRQTRV